MTDSDYDLLEISEAVAHEVIDERIKQVEKWGDQAGEAAGIPLVFGEGARREFARSAVKWKVINDVRALEGALAWDGILLEEVFEALAEADPANVRAELVQVAAVAFAAIEAIDRSATATPVEEDAA